MNSEMADRFAEALLATYCDERTFDVEVSSQDLDAVKDALEKRGCRVQANPFRNILTATCPSDVC